MPRAKKVTEEIKEEAKKVSTRAKKVAADVKAETTTARTTAKKVVADVKAEEKKVEKEVKAAAEKAVEQIMTEMEKVRQGDTDRNALINEFKKYKNITKLSRAMAVSLINKINVFEEKKIEILFDCNDALKTYLEQAKDIKQAELSKKEAV